MTRAVAANRTDVFFSPSVYSYFPLPPWQRAVVTVHDAIPERFPAMTMPTRRARWFWNAKVWLALRQARLVLTVSEYAADEIASALGVARGRIRVAVEAPAAAYQPSRDARVIEEVAARYGLGPGDRWFVYVGGFNPHKRLDMLIRAHASVVNRANGRAPHLLLVGNAAADSFFKAVEQIRGEIETSGTGPLVHWTGFVSDEDLRHLHSGAVAVVLPSQSEGFGLPAVEGAACGTPVIATTASPLPQLLESGGLFVAPGDAVAIAEAMECLLGDEALRTRLGTCAGERARALSWDAGAMAALGALREAAA
jgi:alpha-1,3-rhamnosyl/mannosyltransferase